LFLIFFGLPNRRLAPHVWRNPRPSNPFLRPMFLFPKGQKASSRAFFFFFFCPPFLHKKFPPPATSPEYGTDRIPPLFSPFLPKPLEPFGLSRIFPTPHPKPSKAQCFFFPPTHFTFFLTPFPFFFFNKSLFYSPSRFFFPRIIGYQGRFPFPATAKLRFSPPPLSFPDSPILLGGKAPLL